MKVIFNREYGEPLKVYQNFDIEKIWKTWPIKGAQVILDGYRNSRISEIFELTVNLQEIETGKRFSLELSLISPYNPDWSHITNAPENSFHGLVLIGDISKYKFFQEGTELISNEKVHNFFRGDYGFKLKATNIFRLKHDNDNFHVIYKVEIIKK